MLSVHSLAVAALLFGQEPVSLSGTVTDMSKAGVVNAKLKLISLDRVLPAVSDQEGHFSSPPQSPACTISKSTRQDLS